MTENIILAGINSALSNDIPEDFVKWIQKVSPKQLVFWKRDKSLHPDFGYYIASYCVSYMFAVSWADFEF